MEKWHQPPPLLDPCQLFPIDARNRAWETSLGDGMLFGSYMPKKIRWLGLLEWRNAFPQHLIVSPIPAPFPQPVSLGRFGSNQIEINTQMATHTRTFSTNTHPLYMPVSFILVTLTGLPSWKKSLEWDMDQSRVLRSSARVRAAENFWVCAACGARQIWHLISRTRKVLPYNVHSHVKICLIMSTHMWKLVPINYWKGGRIVKILNWDLNNVEESGRNWPMVGISQLTQESIPGTRR